VNLKGRLYDPHLGRFLSPDPFVSRPHFSQSWNKYSYVLNNPLAYVDPTGFTEDDSHAADPFPGFTMWTPWPGPPLHVTITPGIDEDAAVEGPLEAAEAGASSVPLDVAATGNVAGAVPQPSPIGNALPRGVSNTIDFILGVHDAADEFAYNAGKTLALNALTFGGYGTYQLGNTLWNGYQEDGILGALNAVNPVSAIALGTYKTLDNIDRGDYRAAGREGGRTAIVAGTTAISAATLAAAVVSAAVARAGATGVGGAASGAPGAYSVAFETTIPKAGTGRYPAHFAAANENLLRAMSDPQLAQMLRQTLGPQFEGTILSPTGRVLGRSPAGWTWHHVPNQPGVLQLVPIEQHAPGSSWQYLLHPNGEGGMSQWGHFY
jgi:hypothetical protein